MSSLVIGVGDRESRPHRGLRFCNEESDSKDDLRVRQFVQYVTRHINIGRKRWVSGVIFGTR